MKIYKIILINIIITLILTEIVLRIFWSNPYAPTNKNAYLHEPKKVIEFRNIDKLYPYDKNVIFKTGIYGEILNKNKSPESYDSYAIALGGSSVESALVPEGKRWPDLLNIPTFNFGKSRLNSSHTIENLKHILNNHELKHTKLFVMDGVNNLHAYLNFGKHELTSVKPEKNEKLYRIILKYYFTPSYFFNLVKRSDYFLFSKLDVERRKMLSELTDNELNKYWRENQEEMFNILYNVYGKINVISKKNGVELIIISQPYSYNDKHKIVVSDLRVTPIINEKNLTLKQSRMLLHNYNELTLKVAEKLSINFIDVAKCFESNDTSKLLYDAFHFTIEGSILFADCINNKL